MPKKKMPPAMVKMMKKHMKDTGETPAEEAREQRAMKKKRR